MPRRSKINFETRIVTEVFAHSGEKQTKDGVPHAFESKRSTGSARRVHGRQKVGLPGALRRYRSCGLIPDAPKEMERKHDVLE